MDHVELAFFAFADPSGVTPGIISAAQPAFFITGLVGAGIMLWRPAKAGRQHKDAPIWAGLTRSFWTGVALMTLACAGLMAALFEQRAIFADSGLPQSAAGLPMGALSFFFLVIVFVGAVALMPRKNARVTVPLRLAVMAVLALPIANAFFTEYGAHTSYARNLAKARADQKAVVAEVNAPGAVPRVEEITWFDPNALDVNRAVHDAAMLGVPGTVWSAAHWDLERSDLGGSEKMARVLVIMGPESAFTLDCGYEHDRLVHVSSADSPHVTYDLKAPGHAMVTALCPTPPNRQRVASFAR